MNAYLKYDWLCRKKTMYDPCDKLILPQMDNINYPDHNKVPKTVYFV